MKYTWILGITLFMDGLQAMVAVSLVVAGLAIVGVGGLVSWIPWIGAILVGLAGATGGALSALGFVLSTCMAIIFNAAFIAMMCFTRLLTVRTILTMRRAPFMIAKIIPVFNLIPFFTIFALLSMRAKAKADKKREVSGKASAKNGRNGESVSGGGESENRYGQEAMGGYNMNEPAEETAEPVQEEVRRQRPVMADILPTVSNQTRSNVGVISPSNQTYALQV